MRDAVLDAESLLPGGRLRMFVGGDWVEAVDGQRLPSIDPCSGRSWTHAPAAGENDVDAAVRAAAAAMSGEWGRQSGFDRARLLNRLADLVERDADRIATIESMDNGKLIRETRATIAQVPLWLRYYASAAGNEAEELDHVDRSEAIGEGRLHEPMTTSSAPNVTPTSAYPE